MEKSIKTRWGANCGSDHELLIAKIRIKLKEVGKTTRYEQNQMLYNYTVEVTNRFKGLDLIDRVLKNYGWRFMTLYMSSDQKHAQEKEMEKRKMVL